MWAHTHFTVVLTLGMTQMKRMSRLRRSTEPAVTAETRTRYQDIPSPEDASFWSHSTSVAQQHTRVAHVLIQFSPIQLNKLTSLNLFRSYSLVAQIRISSYETALLRDHIKTMVLNRSLTLLLTPLPFNICRSVGS